MSLAAVAPCIEMTSGAIQFGVPFTSVAAARPRVVLSAFRLSDTPKSDSLMLPFFVERTLAAAGRVGGEKRSQLAACEGQLRKRNAPLRSQCTTPSPCK